jgi:prepilin-type processing-associated H-X9-DG protein
VDYGTGDPRTGLCAGALGSPYLYTYWEPDRSGGRDKLWYKFGSRHTNVFNVAFADGSVHGLSNNIDYTTWVVLGGIADGWVLKDF